MQSRVPQIAFAMVLFYGTVAHANPYIDVASAADADDPFDLNVSVDYEFSLESASIKRELSGFPGADPDGPVPIAKDLVFRAARHEIVPRIEVGVFHDISVYGALPVVLSQTRRLEFDQGASPCVFPGDATPPTCINAANSTTVGDGLLPDTGFDSSNPSGPGFTNPSSPLIFRGVNRSGLDQLHLGASWAPMNQQRDETKPTWKLAAEVRIAVGSIMKFDPRNPDSKAGVSRGTHEVKLSTSIAKRTAWAIPYVDLSWIASFSEKKGSQFRGPPQGEFGARRLSPQQLANARFGVEAITWRGNTREHRVGIDASALMTAHFEGRGYSEMWEVFALAGDAARGGPLVLEADPTAGGPSFSHPGVTNIENYLSLGGRLGVNAALGPRVRLGGHFSYDWHQSHSISFADAGVDRPTCRGGQTAGCEVESNTLIDQGTEEVNPLHSPVIDSVGHRYRVDNSRAYLVSVNATVLF